MELPLLDILQMELDLGEGEGKENLKSEDFDSSPQSWKVLLLKDKPVAQKCSLFFKTLLKEMERGRV